MNTPEILVTLQNTAFFGGIRGDVPGTEWWFPVIETVHVFALSVVFGSIALIDLRLLGISATRTPVSRLSEEVLPWTWFAWVVAAIFGSLLFISKADTYWHNHETRMKFLFMAIAGLNMAVFQFGAYRGVVHWGNDRSPPPTAKLAGAISLCCWILVVYYGRLIGFKT